MTFCRTDLRYILFGGKFTRGDIAECGNSLIYFCLEEECSGWTENTMEKVLVENSINTMGGELYNNGSLLAKKAPFLEIGSLQSPLFVFSLFLYWINSILTLCKTVKGEEKNSHQCLCQLFFCKLENISEFLVGEVLDYYSWMSDLL